MRIKTSTSLRVPALSALAACLGIALAQSAATATSVHDQNQTQRTVPPDLSAILPPYVRLQRARGEAADPNHPQAGTDHVVTSCADDGSPGTLRSIIEDTVNTVSGDSINLTMLPMGCSRITLGTGNIHREIDVLQDTLHIHGPGASALTIDGNDAQSIFFHFGNGTLGISNVTISNGRYYGVYAYGGCIYSNANVLLFNSIVSECAAAGASSQHETLGGAVFTAGYLALFNSAVLSNRAVPSQGNGKGGGVYSRGLLTSVYSTIADNFAVGGGAGSGFGGGVFSSGGIDIEESTISTNATNSHGGVDVRNGTATIINSTISGNSGNVAGGGVYTTAPTTIANSTIAFNTSGAIVSNVRYSAGLDVQGASLTLWSSIIANNRGYNGQDDLNGTPGTIVAGGNNLITSWNSADVDIPADTRTSCPKLDPLANNGGSTLTHKLRHNSPAIDHGDPGSLQWDQRGDPRVYPDLGMADIGAVEWQPTDQDERILANGFDGVCDW